MLYICATPIGNLEDITLRTLRVLREVDAIYAEDTRHTLILLNHCDIKKPLISCHEHNEASRAEEIANRLEAGENIAYVSDAGTPLISDPGARIVAECIKRGIEFTVLPGACAATTGLILAGLGSDAFYFAGFLPRTGSARKQKIDSLAVIQGAIILYESPNRVGAMLQELAKRLGDRRCALVREMTKVHEEVVRGTLTGLSEVYAKEPPRGECVLVIEGAELQAKPAAAPEEIEAAIDKMSTSGMKPRAIAREIAQRFSISANDAYAMVVEKKDE